MSNKSDKYYNENESYPKSTYKGNKQTTYMKTIRLTKDEINTWKSIKLSKRIHKILAGEDQSNDSIKINKLKNYLKGLYDIMNTKMDPKTNLEPENMELLLNIEEVISYE